MWRLPRQPSRPRRSARQASWPEGSSERSGKCEAARSTRGRRRAASGVELGPLASMLPQDVAWGEPGAVAFGEPFQIGDNALGAQVVGVPQRAAAERWKSEAENGANVPVARVAHDAVSQRPCGFVDHAEHEPLQNLRGTRTAVGMDVEQAVDTLID